MLELTPRGGRGAGGGTAHELFRYFPTSHVGTRGIFGTKY